MTCIYILKRFLGDEDDDENDSLRSDLSSYSILTQPPTPKRRVLSYSERKEMMEKYNDPAEKKSVVDSPYNVKD